jgi:hypothetical protein
MSTEMTLFKGGVPSYLKGAVDPVTAALAGSSGGMRRISIKGGVFREMVGGNEYRVSEDRAMNIIVVNAAPSISRTYYSGSYSEGTTVAPTCWSSNSQKPDESVKNKQSNTCLNCPQNIKGSGQGDSRACRFSQRLAVVVDGEVEKEHVYQLVLPSTSIFGDGEKNKMPLQAYARFLADNGFPIFGVVTEMRFDTSSPTPKLTFKPVRPVTEEEYELIQHLKDSPDAKKAIELTVSQVDGVQTKEALQEEFVPAPKSTKPKLEAPKVEELEAVIEEPKKAASTKKAPVANEPKLEDLVGEWDD